MPNNQDFEYIYKSDMEKLISALFSQYAQFTDMKYRNKNDKDRSYIDEILSLWNDIIKDRNLNFNSYKLYASGHEIINYSFNDLSDGEKSIFYYISHVILAPKNSYIIIDEPENHLNINVCTVLRNRLEEKRNDCKSIYLTHNLDFVSTRINSTIIWNKSFKLPYEWEFTELPKNDVLPEKLIMEIMGSRNNILFCEGTKDSLDHKLYSILFPNLKVVPIGGHNDVIESVRAFNYSGDFLTKAFGIIDGDYHLPEQIEKWEEQGIYSLQVNEIENLLCDQTIIKEAVNYFCFAENSLQIIMINSGIK